MYTRCPSCRAEITFQAPANVNDLPDGYKHRIKCPSCGVTIGVRIPKVQTEAMVYQPQNPYATSPEPTFTATATETTEASFVAETPAKAKSAKKPGTLRNVFMMIFSLVFIAANVVAYLIGNGTIVIPEGFEWANSITLFNGIGGFEALITDFAGFSAAFTSELFFKEALLEVFAMASFVFAGINFIVSLLALIGKKYARAWFVISSLLMALIVWASVLLMPLLMGISNGNAMEALTDVFTNETSGLLTITNCFAFAIILWVSLQFIFSLFFTKSLKRKNK